jgi:hypothetical protein
MKFGADELDVRSSGTPVRAGSAHINEVDLYDELATFSALSPEEQLEELERIERANAQPALTVDDPSPGSIDFVEQSDAPTRAECELDRSPEPLFNLIDESRFEPLEQPQTGASVEPAFAFLEPSAEEPWQSRQASHLSSECDDSLGVTSPLGDICPDAPLLTKPAKKCDSCGAALAIEDLFCLSCGQLIGDLDL